MNNSHTPKILRPVGVESRRRKRPISTELTHLEWREQLQKEYTESKFMQRMKEWKTTQT